MCVPPDADFRKAAFISSPRDKQKLFEQLNKCQNDTPIVSHKSLFSIGRFYYYHLRYEQRQLYKRTAPISRKANLAAITCQLRVEVIERFSAFTRTRLHVSRVSLTHKRNAGLVGIRLSLRQRTRIDVRIMQSKVTGERA